MRDDRSTPHSGLAPAAARARGAVLALLACIGWPLLAPAAGADVYPDPPQVLFKDLFVAVQSAGIFTDGKAFPDATPKESPAEILALYHAEHPDSRQALERFIEAHFAMPAMLRTPPSSPGLVPIIEHIDQLWNTLTRRSAETARYSSLLPLPQPFVVPGGRFREIYYWDSYFTMLGLQESAREDLVADMVRDFAYLVDAYGHVPNGTRSYYLSRSQPPFFFDMVALLSKERPDAAYARYLPQLRREYAFWMEGAAQLRPGGAHRRVVGMPDGSILNRYWDDRDTPRDEAYREDVELASSSGRPAQELYRDIRAAAESGWDFGSRWFEDGQTRARIDTTQIVPVDLNSLLFGLEQAIGSGCERRGERACAREFARRAEHRRRAIDRYLWSESSGAYLDYRWTQQQPIDRLSAATLYPLFTGAASASQAAAVAQTTIRELLKPGGIVTTPLATGEQWDAPNGWAPIQWIAVSGLRQYGQRSLAAIIACRWIGNVENVYQRSGKLVEKYDVVTTGRSGGGGEYPTQDGFGWTNGVTRKLLALYPGACAAP